jgi:hypothetical protein
MARDLRGPLKMNFMKTYIRNTVKWAFYIVGLGFTCCHAQTNFDDTVRCAASELNQHIIWSEQFTNGIMAGVYVDQLSISNKMFIQVSKNYNLSTLSLIPAFIGDATNCVFVWLAPQKSWEIDLKSSIGEVVPKTTLGKQLGQKLKIGNRGMEKAGFSAIRVNSDLPYLPGPEFKLSDLFELNRLDDYTLKIAFCGMVITNNQPVPAYFNPITIKLKVTD